MTCQFCWGRSQKQVFQGENQQLAEGIKKENREGIPWNNNGLTPYPLR
jgi:hypothetical protein